MVRQRDGPLGAERETYGAPDRCRAMRPVQRHGAPSATVEPPVMPFSELGLSDKVLQAVEASGYTEPTPIQAQAIPHVLARRDVLGIAQTGTGKQSAGNLQTVG